VLLSAATSDYAALLLGVNAGGLGLPTASIANLLGYRAAASEVEKKEFLKLSLGVGFVVQTLCGIFLNLLR
jgi:Na+/H+ antiporter NhaD/arsenite permease-like protein